MEWADGDLSKVNIAPHAAERLARKYDRSQFSAIAAE